MTPARRQRFAFAVALLILVGVALALRLPTLAARPMHADESVHAAKFRDLWETGDYRYDPNEFHGPTLYFATLPVMAFRGRATFAATQASDYRLVPALFGAGLLLLLPLFADALGGRRAALAAGALFAVSPAFVFYSAYYIQEIPFVFFSLATMGCAWRWRQGCRVGTRAHWAWAVGAGVFAGLALASKETAVVSALAAGGGAALFALVFPQLPAGDLTPLPASVGDLTPLPPLRSGEGESKTAGIFRYRIRHRWDLSRLPLAGTERGQGGEVADGRGQGGEVAENRFHNAPLRGLPAFGCFVIALLTAALFLTDFLRHPLATLDYLRAFAPWLHRGTGTDLHRHPWAYYLAVLFWTHPTPRSPIWSEAFIGAFAVIGAAAAFAPRGGRLGRFAETLHGDARAFLRFLTIDTLLLLAAYSAIPYKTPWCVLSIDAGLILLAGAGIGVSWRVATGRLAHGFLFLLLALGTTQLAYQAARDSGPLCVDARNPYVYAGTAPEIDALVTRVDALTHAQTGTDASSTTIQVCSADGYYWPLPWYLRRYPHVGYCTGLPPAGDAAAPIVIASPELDDALTTRLTETHLMTGYFGLRNGVLVEVWVRQDLWENYLKARKSAK